VGNLGDFVLIRLVSWMLLQLYFAIENHVHRRFVPLITRYEGCFFIFQVCYLKLFVFQIFQNTFIGKTLERRESSKVLSSVFDRFSLVIDDSKIFYNTRIVVVIFVRRLHYF